MREVKNIVTYDNWKISNGDYKSSSDYSKSHNQIRKKSKFVKRIVLFFTVSLSFIVLIIVLSMLAKFDALK